MNELIKVDFNSEKPTVSGRELHAALEIETPYHKWFPRMCEYGFIEGVEFARSGYGESASICERTAFTCNPALRSLDGNRGGSESADSGNAAESELL